MSRFRKRTQSKKTKCFEICQITGLTPIQGEVGLEIEVEGTAIPKSETDLKPWWCWEVDHSLRGEDNAEYVLKDPILFDEVDQALKHLWNVFNKYGTCLDDSNRTSVHVHLNVQRFHLWRLASFLALYFTVEDILTSWCGDHRIGNLFCLRAKDAPSIVTQARTWIQRSGGYLNDHLHYAGMSMSSLYKFGSVESRTLRGPIDSKDYSLISDWVSILRRLYELSDTYRDPRDICGEFSGYGPLDFFEKVMGPTTSLVHKHISMSEDEIKKSMYEGIRLAQELCFARDWDQDEYIDAKFDPFNRAKTQHSSTPSYNFESFNIPLTNTQPYVEPTPGPIFYEGEYDGMDEI